jgi:hypothetical protein
MVAVSFTAGVDDGLDLIEMCMFAIFSEAWASPTGR